MNENSTVKFEDKFVFKNQLPASVADTLYNSPIGSVYGPYRDGDLIKLSKIVAEKQMPDSVKAKHILVSWKGLQTQTDSLRTKEQAKVLADSILSVVKKDDSKFSDLAKKYSADTSSKVKGGDLGYFTSGTMVPAFNDYVFENAAGDIAIVETQFGYHIISITDQKNKQKAIKLATVVQDVEPSETTLNDVFKNTTRFEMAAGKGDFNKVAQKDNLTVNPVNQIGTLDEFIPGLGSQRSIVRWAFNEDTEVNDIKRFQVNDGFAIVRLTSKSEKGLQSAKIARTTVKPILIKEKKAEQLKAKIKGGSLEEIAKAASVSVKNAASLTQSNPTISGAGNEPKVVGAAFGLEKGKISKPIIGEYGVYVVEVTGKTESKELDNYQSFANKETTDRMNAVNSQVFKALEDKAVIEDNRSAFY